MGHDGHATLDRAANGGLLLVSKMTCTMLVAIEWCSVCVCAMHKELA